jgi:hypothetical protein
VFLLFVVLTFLCESFAGSGLFILPLVQEASLLEAFVDLFLFVIVTSTSTCDCLFVFLPLESSCFVSFDCPNDWVCRKCHESGHKMMDCSKDFNEENSEPEQHHAGTDDGQDDEVG